MACKLTTHQCAAPQLAVCCPPRGFRQRTTVLKLHREPSSPQASLLVTMISTSGTVAAMRTCGPGERGNPVEALCEQAGIGDVCQRAVQAPEERDGGEGGQQACRHKCASARLGTPEEAWACDGCQWFAVGLRWRCTDLTCSICPVCGCAGMQGFGSSDVSQSSTTLAQHAFSASASGLLVARSLCICARLG